MDELAKTRLNEGLERLPASLRQAIDLAASIGDERAEPVYLVGGIVRDLLLGRTNVDVDLVIEGNVLRLARRLSLAFMSPMHSHKRFGTARVYLPSDRGAAEYLDLAASRSERYAHPGALPEIQKGKAIDDARRRDFTINAIGVRLNGPFGSRGTWIDPCNGLSDLRAGLIRVLHPLSFIDDPTRIFRAVRFSARFGFTIEPATLQWLREALASQRLASISRQRVRHEIELMCQEEHPGRGLLLAAELGIWSSLLPGWEPLRAPLLDDDRLDTHLAGWSDIVAARWTMRHQLALCCLFGGLPAAQHATLTQQLAFTRQRALLLEVIQEQGRSTHAALVALRSSGETLPSPSAAHSVLGAVSLAALVFFDLIWDQSPVERAAIQRELRVTRQVQLQIRGEDLIAAGVRAGPAIGQRLALTLAAKQDGALPTREAELAFALKP